MALFEPDGHVLIPTDLAVGPWSPDALAGGPVAAILARAVEACPAATPMQVTRLTIELMRAVPRAPLQVTAEVVRPGRRVERVEAHVTPAGAGLERAVARVMALRVRTAAVEVAEGDAEEGPLFPDPSTVPRSAPSETLGRGFTYHLHAVDMRFVRGSYAPDGPATVWTRLLRPVVAGEETSPLQRLAAAADLGSGISSSLPIKTHTFLNADLSAVVHRLPAGEWVGLDARTELAANGLGLTDTVVFDTRGRLGRILQCLVVDRRV